jgi:hypothetical protein
MTTQGTRSSSPDGTGTYDIKLQGHLDRHWAERLDVPELIHEPDGTTVLRGVTADQAALHGRLQRIRDLGVTLISVIFVPDEPSN